MCDKCQNCPYPERTKCVGGDIKKCNITREQLKRQIKEVLNEIYEEEYYLIENKVNEVCIVAHFWRYFLNKYQAKYEDFDMDAEYNRNGKWAKYYGMTEEHQKLYAKPDMVIHKRGCNYHNFLCIEFKGYWNTENARNDEQKLKAFTNQEVLLDYDGKKYSYNYSYGIRLKLYKDKVKGTWFENGRHVEQHDFMLNI